ncbi:2,3-bisphosphoglycerate-independent phosphoglycerate mutase [Candidatus Nitrososphaera gargensis Ga9.2]|uniref:2,3-bisphosphoglycerate-independent phosphoglycerate mutase n=2 Tax=Candidatus Nitrososphaera gargensis TaxID=497727 RepID=K0IAV7_NITGG|nr:2,3-bisphosphoglycerate-independent phosphoglycerate mutase [Candidatus Nitrososphaera gargensis Ga9.2]
MTKSSSVAMKGIRLVYVLLDGIGDLPHPLLNDLTPLEAAYTPNLDALARNGAMGKVISVGKGIAPQSDIAVFNMLGYSFKDGSYVGRGVIESIGCNIDFRDGDLALRGNFATIDDKLKIVDRRAGRVISSEEAKAVCKTLRDNIRFSDKDASIALEPTIAHRVVIRLRHAKMKLSDKITNTDPAYDKIDGMGIAKDTTGEMFVQKSAAEEDSDQARTAAKMLNEFTTQVVQLLRDHPVNRARIAAGKKPMNCIIARDSGNRYPHVDPIDKKHGISVGCIVDMPVEIGISKVLGMKMFQAGDVNDYEEKAKVAAKSLKSVNAVYVHIKGPDEFGHDGDARGKKKNIEDIDKRFFGTLMNELKGSSTAIVVSGDHSTPCVKKGHSDDPVPLLVSGSMVKQDGSARFTENYAKRGNLGLLMGADVLSTAIKMVAG